jgi:hypothetical protein
VAGTCSSSVFPFTVGVNNAWGYTSTLPEISYVDKFLTFYGTFYNTVMTIKIRQ